MVADVDADGKAIKGKNHTYALCGEVRAMGEADDVSNLLVSWSQTLTPSRSTASPPRTASSSTSGRTRGKLPRVLYA